MNHAVSISLCSLVLMTGCVTVSVMPSGNSVATMPKAENCTIEFFRTTKPDRPYVEIGTISAEGSRDTPPATEQESIRKKACELGADAVIVTRESAPQNGMIGVAIKYK